MAHVDLDALRAARAEALQEPNLITFGGREFKLVSELSIDAVIAYRGTLGTGGDDADHARKLVELMLADPAEADDFWAMRPSWADINELFRALVPPKREPGESSASQPSSPKGGKRSRPTSPRTTS